MITPNVADVAYVTMSQKIRSRSAACKLAAQAVGRLRVIDNAKVSYLNVMRLDLGREDVELPSHLIEQSLELRPVGVMAYAKHADVGRQRLPARYPWKARRGQGARLQH